MEPHELYVEAFELAAQGCYVEARQLLEQCLARNPAHILALKELAFVLRMVGDLPEALAHRLQVKRLDPADLGNRYHLANLLFLLGQKTEAAQEMEALLALEPDNKRFCALKNVITTADFRPAGSPKTS